MDTHPLKLKVRSYAAETPFIRSLVFGVEDGVAPRWQAGAHIRVALPNGGDRPYSLMALPGLPEGTLALGVLREEASTGGSQFMHALKIGDVVKATAPVNNFHLHEEAAPALLFAGGIGVTPILSMAANLAAREARIACTMRAARKACSRSCRTCRRSAPTGYPFTTTATSPAWTSQRRSAMPPQTPTSTSAARPA